jgi:pheromone shutdown-related protein TraB
MGKIIIVPTSHIAEQSIRQVRETISREQPDCVAVELDINRFYALRNKQASQLAIFKTVGISTYLVYILMKKLQEWLGKKVGILPGAEMLAAVRAGEEHKTTIAFIDRDIRLTFLRLNGVSRREKAKLIWFVVKGTTVGFLSSKIRRHEIIDLRNVPPKALIHKALTIIKQEFPQLYKVLITERDHHMAHKLRELSQRFEKTVAVVGAGHYDALQQLLKP